MFDDCNYCKDIKKDLAEAVEKNEKLKRTDMKTRNDALFQEKFMF